MAPVTIGSGPPSIAALTLVTATATPPRSTAATPETATPMPTTAAARIPETAATAPRLAETTGETARTAAQTPAIGTTPAIAEATTPNSIAAPGEMNPAAGVTVASPAMAPVAKPTLVGLPTCHFSMASQASAAMLAATWVLRIAAAASSLAASAEPPLNPNQPIHSSPAPAMVRAGLCGSISTLGKPARLPSSSATTSAETPAVV